MGYRDRFGSLKRFYPCGDVVDCMEYIGAVVSAATLIAHAYGHVLKDDEAVFMFEGFTLDLLRSNGAFAVLASIAVHIFIPQIR
jgi:hypothetical protein